MRVATAALLCLFPVLLTFAAVSPQAASLPAQLTDAEFWRIFTDLSEPGGNYPYENFVTNEETIQDVMPVLTKVTKPGGVYLGVGPEQNFTYISGIKPRMAFVFDIRRQNAIEHLLYRRFSRSRRRAAISCRTCFPSRTPTKRPLRRERMGCFWRLTD